MRLFLLATVIALHLALAHGAIFDHQARNGNRGFEELPEGDKRKNDHQRFFEKLTSLEREWVIRLAIKQERDELARREASVILPVLQPHEGPEEEQPRQRNPYSSAKKLTKPGKPGLPGFGDIGIKPIDSLDVLPPGLLDYLLNGQISPKFQKDLIRWLRDEYGFNDAGFLSFSTNSNEYCQGKQCWDLGDIGGECCPFG